MSSIILERKNNVPNPLPSAPLTGTDGISRGLGNFCAGQRVLLRCRYAEFYINGVTCPPTDGPYNLEGPYLRITPIPIVNEDKAITGNWNDKLQQQDYATSAGIKHVSALDPAADQLYYEIDANNCSVYLPFDCSLELYTDFSGVWLYDVYKFRSDMSDGTNSAQNTNLKQTRNVMGGNRRDVPVPTGAHGFQVIGDSNAQFVPTFSEVLPGAGIDSPTLQNTILPVGNWPYSPGVLGNARLINVHASMAVHDAAVVFGIQFP